MTLYSLCVNMSIISYLVFMSNLINSQYGQSFKNRFYQWKSSVACEQIKYKVYLCLYACLLFAAHLAHFQTHLEQKTMSLEFLGRSTSKGIHDSSIRADGFIQNSKRSKQAVIQLLPCLGVCTGLQLNM